MPVNPKDGKFIYHLTSIKNIESIFDSGLQPRALLNEKSIIDVADPEIIKYRIEYGITNYIPFHFFANTPFAGAVVKKYSSETFVYIAIKRSYAANNGFKIIPKHPMSHDMKYAPNIYDYEEGIKRIDWEAMNRRDYRDEYCKNVCMAECVFDGVIDIQNLISYWYVKFYVHNEAVAKYIKDLCQRKYGICPDVSVNPHMFANI